MLAQVEAPAASVSPQFPGSRAVALGAVPVPMGPPPTPVGAHPPVAASPFNAVDPTPADGIDFGDSGEVIDDAAKEAAITQVWKLKSASGLTYNFHGLPALLSWAATKRDLGAMGVSLNGSLWKDFESFYQAFVRTDDPVAAIEEAPEVNFEGSLSPGTPSRPRLNTIQVDGAAVANARIAADTPPAVRTATGRMARPTGLPPVSANMRPSSSTLRSPGTEVPEPQPAPVEQVPTPSLPRRPVSTQQFTFRTAPMQEKSNTGVWIGVGIFTLAAAAVVALVAMGVISFKL